MVFFCCFVCCSEMTWEGVFFGVEYNPVTSASRLILLFVFFFFNLSRYKRLIGSTIVVGSALYSSPVTPTSLP